MSSAFSTRSCSSLDACCLPLIIRYKYALLIFATLQIFVTDTLLCSTAAFNSSEVIIALCSFGACAGVNDIAVYVKSPCYIDRACHVQGPGECNRVADDFENRSRCVLDNHIAS